MNECLNEYSLSLTEVIAMLSLAFTVGGTAVALWMYFRTKKSRKRKLERRVEENINDLNVNNKKSLVDIGAVASDEIVTVSKASWIARQTGHLVSLKDRYPGTLQLITQIRDDAKELGLDI